MKNNLKILLIVIALLLLAVLTAYLVVGLVMSGFFADYSDDVETFPEKYEDFELIKDMILSCGMQDDGFLIERDDDGKITGLYRFSVPMDQSQLDALNSLDELFYTNFSYIRISENSVRFEGATQIFVYSFDGSRPKYFYDEDDNFHFSVVALGNQWYYLCTNFR